MIEGRYDRALIRAIVVLAYGGWIAHTASIILLPSRTTTPSAIEVAPAAAVLGTLWSFFAIQKSPGSFYAYVAFPVYFWNSAIRHSVGPLRQLLGDRKISIATTSSWIAAAGAVIATLLAMVVSR
jgi:GPI ethanolamine phosphate transferase 1